MQTASVTKSFGTISIINLRVSLEFGDAEDGHKRLQSIEMNGKLLPRTWWWRVIWVGVGIEKGNMRKYLKLYSSNEYWNCYSIVRVV